MPFERFAGVVVTILLAASALALHPANIPVARAKIATDGKVELKVSFDILAFALGEDPTKVLDPDMNALLDGPSADLDAKLTAAKQTFADGIEIVGGNVADIAFPDAAAIHKLVETSPPPRLPVMAEVTVKMRLPPVVNRTSFRFPALLGTVVLTSERPACEPVTEQVAPSEASLPLKIPTKAEVEVLTAARKADAEKNDGPKPTSVATAKVEIQARYDLWSKAYMAHDVETLLSILSPGYTLKTAKGAVISYEEYKAMLELRKKKRDDTTGYRTEIQRITLTDGVAAIYARETTTNPKLNAESATYQHDYIDAWEFRAGKWTLKSTVTLKEQEIAPSPGGDAGEKRVGAS